MLVDFTGDAVYAVNAATGLIYRFNIGTSVTWYNMDAVAAAASGVVLTDDGTLYMADNTANIATPIRRTIQPTFGPLAPAPTFEWIGGLAAGGAGVRLNVISAAPAANGNEIAVAQGAAVFMYTDILSAGSTPPVLVSPADAFEVGIANAVVLSIENVAGVTTWQIALSNDETFTNNVDAATFTQVPPATSVTVNLAAAGPVAAGVSVEAPIYWMVRSAAANPLLGPWSEIRVLHPQPIAGVNAPATNSPAGVTAIDVPVNPVFNWGIYKYATGYHLQVAKDAGFINVIVDANVGNVTSYYLAEALDYDSAYFWRIKGLTATGSTDWSAAVGFTTESAPVEAAPPVIVEETPPPQITVETPAPTELTPNWIYAIIVVGAVLVIAVIILIVRTGRRVP
jgi:hypothetical protein